MSVLQGGPRAVAATVPAARPARRRRSRGASVNLMYVPALALFAVFVFWPLLQGAGIALTNWDGYSAQRSYVGLDNFRRLLSDASFHTALRNTVLYGVGCTLLQQVLGLGLALLLDGTTRRRSFARAVVYLPVLVSPVVMGMTYYFVVQYGRGALNDVIGLAGLAPVAWLSSGPSALTIIVVVNTLQFVGISMVIYLAGLQAVPVEVNEAAALDGSYGWSRLRHVTVPLLAPAFTSSVVINLIGGLKLFDVVQVMTAGGPGTSTHSVSTLVALTYFGQQSAGYASAMGVVLFVLIAVASVALVVRMNRQVVS